MHIIMNELRIIMHKDVAQLTIAKVSVEFQSSIKQFLRKSAHAIYISMSTYARSCLSQIKCRIELHSYSISSTGEKLISLTEKRTDKEKYDIDQLYVPINKREERDNSMNKRIWIIPRTLHAGELTDTLYRATNK